MSNQSFVTDFFILFHLSKLIKAPKLAGLVGGFETVTLGDEAEEEAKIQNLSKLKKQRSGEPTFDIIIELSRTLWDEWTVVLDTAKAVDAILEGAHYQVQRRTREPATGKFRINEGAL